MSFQRKASCFALKTFVLSLVLAFATAALPFSVAAAPAGGFRINVTAVQNGDQVIAELHMTHGAGFNGTGGMGFQISYNHNALTYVSSTIGAAANWNSIFPINHASPGTLEAHFDLVNSLLPSGEGLIVSSTFSINPNVTHGTSATFNVNVLAVEGFFTNMPIPPSLIQIVPVTLQISQPTFSVLGRAGIASAITPTPTLNNLTSGEMTSLRQWHETGGFAPTPQQQVMRDTLPALQTPEFKAALVRFGRNIYTPVGSGMVYQGRTATATIPNPSATNFSTAEMNALRIWQITGGFNPTPAQQVIRDTDPQFQTTYFQNLLQRAGVMVYVMD